MRESSNRSIKNGWGKIWWGWIVVSSHLSLFYVFISWSTSEFFSSYIPQKNEIFFSRFFPRKKKRYWPLRQNLTLTNWISVGMSCLRVSPERKEEWEKTQNFLWPSHHQSSWAFLGPIKLAGGDFAEVFCVWPVGNRHSDNQLTEGERQNAWGIMKARCKCLSVLKYSIL